MTSQNNPQSFWTSWKLPEGGVERLTLILLWLMQSSLDSMDSWGTQAMSLGWVMAGLVHPDLVSRSLFWAVGAAWQALLLSGAPFDLPGPHYLAFAWVLALMVVRRLSGAEERTSAEAHHAVGLLVFVLVANVLWKLTQPGYLQGNFHTLALLTDERFSGLVEVFAGLMPVELEANRMATQAFQEGYGLAPGAEVQLLLNPSLVLLSRLLTWGGILLPLAGVGALVVPMSKGGRGIRCSLLFALGLYLALAMPESFMASWVALVTLVRFRGIQGGWHVGFLLVFVLGALA